MNAAIEYQRHQPNTLKLEARKKKSSAQFYWVEEGALLVRLGRNECVVAQGSGIWLPADCLFAVSLLPHSVIHQISFSVRALAELPLRVGYVQSSPLILGILEALQKQDNNQWDSSYGRLLRTLRDYLSSVDLLSEHAQSQQLSELIAARTSSNALNSTDEFLVQSQTGFTSSEFTAFILAKRCITEKKSGKTTEQIAQSLTLTTQDVEQLLTLVG